MAYAVPSAVLCWSMRAACRTTACMQLGKCSRPAELRGARDMSCFAPKG